MVLTLTGVITSPEPGLGVRERTAAGCVAAGIATVATEAGSSVVSGAEEPMGAIMSARAKRCSNGVFGGSTAAFGGSATTLGSAAILGSATLTCSTGLAAAIAGSL